MGDVIVRPELVPGTRIEVESGVFKGFKGIVERRKDGMKLIVNLEMLNQSAETEIDAADLTLDE